MNLRSWSPQRPDDYDVVVRDVTGQQVANTRLPWGSTLPKGANLPIDQQVIATKEPVIQDLFTGATAGHPIISIRIPVPKDDTVTHVLSMAVEPRRIAETLLAQNLPASSFHRSPVATRMKRIGAPSTSCAAAAAMVASFSRSIRPTRTPANRGSAPEREAHERYQILHRNKVGDGGSNAPGCTDDKGPGRAFETVQEERC